MKTILLCLSVAVLAGCTTNNPVATGTKGPAAICHVCRYNNDLACVCVRVKDTTPHTEYNGHTYYFCSEDCRTAFLKKPVEYLPK